MVNRPGMTLALALGAICSVAVLSTIPLYTDAILQRLLIKELESFQIETGVYPGSCSLSYNLFAYQGELPRAQYYRRLTDALRKQYIPKLRLPVDLEVRQVSLEKIYLEDDRLPYQQDLTGQIAIESMTDIAEHITLVAGRMAANTKTDGVYEIIVTEEALNFLNILMDRPYSVMDAYTRTRMFTVKVVGVFAVKERRDPYWFKPLEYYRSSLFLDETLFEKDFIDTESEKLGYARWFFALDYHALRVRDLKQLGDAILSNAGSARSAGLLFEFPAAESFREYERKARIMRLILSFLQTPLLLMIVFFVYMISHLGIQSERNEIAVLRSRGSSTSQLLLQHLMKGGLLGILALAAGPPLGILVSRILGSANGFMEFVKRTGLPVAFSSSVVIYALAGIAVFIAAMILPVVFALRSSIVEYKMKLSSQGRRKPGWMRYFVDIALLAIAGYGMYSYRIRKETLITTAAVGTDVPVDPLLFGIAIIFILGAALLTLRLFPPFLRLIHKTIASRLPAPLFAALIHTERSVGMEQFLMVFLIIALSMGIYNATAARTINENAKDRVRYAIGADIVIKPAWNPGSSPTSGTLLDEEGAEGDTRVAEWREPPFHLYAGLRGVEAATRVVRIDAARVAAGNRGRSAVLLAITPGEFGRVAWMRHDLLPTHWFHYLNLLGRYENGVLLSTSVGEDLGVKPGDSILFSWPGQSRIAAVVYGFFDYWPTFNSLSRSVSGRNPGMIVANYRFVQNASVLQPYEIWIRANDDAGSDNEILQDAIDRKLPMSSVSTSSKGIIEAANDPIVQSTNGILTLGFLVSMAICFAGFVIYWVLTLKSRELEFGASRAMGIRKRDVTAMLLAEQFLIIGASVLFGALIGRAASILFIPLLQTVYGAAEQVPPFRIVERSTDFVRIYAVCGVMIGFVSILFRILVSRLRIHEVLKLSEG